MQSLSRDFKRKEAMTICAHLMWGKSKENFAQTKNEIGDSVKATPSFFFNPQRGPGKRKNIVKTSFAFGSSFLWQSFKLFLEIDLVKKRPHRERVAPCFLPPALDSFDQRPYTAATNHCDMKCAYITRKFECVFDPPLSYLYFAAAAATAASTTTADCVLSE